MSSEPAGADRTSVLDTLSSRTILLCIAVALIAAFVTVAVSIPLISGAARAQASATLDGLADVTVAALEKSSFEPQVSGLDEVLTSQDIRAYLIGTNLQPIPGLSGNVARAVLNGEEVSTEATLDGADYLVAARPVDSGYGVVLLAPVDSVVEPPLQGLRRLLYAVLVGVVVASVIGYLFSKRLTRPLRQFADTARALSVGERGRQVSVHGPREVTDIARSLNELSAALEVSEGRQREFLLSVSHELRTPLTAIRGYAEAFADGMVPGDDTARTGQVMTAEADRLDRLVADLLDLSRLDAVDVTIEPVDVDLVELARQAAEVWRARCERVGVQFTAELPAQPVWVRTDPVRTRQIIDNLAENALRVTPAGRPIVLAVATTGQHAALSVRDGGPGLTPQDMAVAFEPAALYSRYQGVRKVGSGVGLALVGRLAGRLGGSAQVATAPEGGAAFTVLLSLAAPVPA